LIIAWIGMIGMVSGANAEDLFSNLPPGVFLQKRIDVPADQRKALGLKLGGEISELTNAFLQMYGRSVQVNVIKGANESSTPAIHAALMQLKAPPFVLSRDGMVIEFVGKDIDESLAIKTSYELGLVPKPARVNYKIRAEIATIDRADYMTCNLLFNELLNHGGSNVSQAPVPASIAGLSSKFQFGHSLILRSPKANAKGAASYHFESVPIRSEEKGVVIRYEFDRLPVRYGIPYVTVWIEMPVDGTGLLKSLVKPGPQLTAATPHWPATDPQFKALAEKITDGCSTAETKVKAILEWLTPGQNIKFSGQTGSRWGASKVLEQRFGHCWDFADRFVTLCRASGVPSRQVAGWLYGSSGHVWAEYYMEGQGWQQADATGGGKLPCGIYHIPWFTTEDGEMPIVYLSMPKIEVK
jgi:Transglutaminase-like superfamily